MSALSILQGTGRILDRVPALELVRVTVPRLGRGTFTLLIAGIFSMSLVGSLVINVALTQGAFQEAALTRDVRNIEAQQQAAQQTLAMLGSPGILESRARAMGMVPVAAPVFLRLSDGQILGKPMPAERTTGSQVIGTLLPSSAFLEPELQMTAAARRTVLVEPRSDAAVELTETAP